MLCEVCRKQRQWNNWEFYTSQFWTCNYTGLRQCIYPTCSMRHYGLIPRAVGKVTPDASSPRSIMNVLRLEKISPIFTQTHSP